MYGRLIKSILYNFLNKLRSELGQEDDLMENLGRTHEYMGSIICYLITRNILVKNTKTLHHNVAMLLFTNKSTRLDIHLRVPFLCTRVKSPALQDRTKIEIIIGCLKSTVQIPFVSETDSNGILSLYVHASFVVHPEYNSHVGTCTRLVQGSMLSLSSKQKSNWKSPS